LRTFVTTAESTASIPTEFCSTTNIGYSPWVIAHRGRSLLSTIALFQYCKHPQQELENLQS